MGLNYFICEMKMPLTGINDRDDVAEKRLVHLKLPIELKYGENRR